MKKIGFVGQGFIGKNMADDFEERGYPVVRYSLEEQYVGNKDLIEGCDIVFVAVPTPSTPDGFKYDAVIEAVSLVGKGKIAVIKSTTLPAALLDLQERFPEVVVTHSPEFLTEKTAPFDARHPDRNIVGFIADADRDRAEEVLAVLPPSPFNFVCGYQEASMAKYGGNNWFVFKVLFMNTLFEICKARGINYQTVIRIMEADPRVGPTHLQAEHQGGRGAGGHCFIKDFAAYVNLFDESIDRTETNILGADLLRRMEQYNQSLLKDSGKSAELLKEVYNL